MPAQPSSPYRPGYLPTITASELADLEIRQAAAEGAAGEWVLVRMADLDELVAFVRELRPLVEQWKAVAARLAAGGAAALFRPRL